MRNLKTSEIVDQVIFVRKQCPPPVITNLVFMGIGEPLDNYDAVMRAVRTMNDADSFRIGARRMTISTCGVVPGIERLSGEGFQVELSVSLHAADDGTRSRLVPINKTYPLDELMNVCRRYTEKTKRVITFEYVRLKGVNSSPSDALRLAGLREGMHCKVNTIAYNQVRAKGYEKPSEGEIRDFVQTLNRHPIRVTHRRSKGEDIDAGCGQLRISAWTRG